MNALIEFATHYMCDWHTATATHTATRTATQQTISALIQFATHNTCVTQITCVNANMLLSALIESATHIICVIDTLQHPATHTATHTATHSATQHIISASIVLATHKVSVTHSTCVNTIWCSLHWSSSRHTIHLWLTHCDILQHTLQYILQRTLQHNPLSVRSSSSRYILLVCTLHAWQMSWHTLTCEIEFVTHITF